MRVIVRNVVMCLFLLLGGNISAQYVALDTLNPITQFEMASYFQTIGDFEKAEYHYLKSLEYNITYPCRVITYMRRMDVDSSRLNALYDKYNCNYHVALYGASQATENSKLISRSLNRKINSLMYLDQNMRMNPHLMSCADMVCVDTTFIRTELMKVFSGYLPDKVDQLIPFHGHLSLLLLHAIRYQIFYDYCVDNNTLETLEQGGVITTYERLMFEDAYRIFSNQKTLYGISFFDVYQLSLDDITEIDERRARLGFLPLKYDGRIIKRRMKLPEEYVDRIRVRELEE